jgi:hypothetical protein
MSRASLLLLLISTAASAQPSHDTCVDVQVGSAQSYACLNQRLAAEAKEAQKSGAAEAPYDATSPSNVTGQFNEEATRNRLGTNFGKSAVPQRPPAIYAPSLGAPKR